MNKYLDAFIDLCVIWDEEGKGKTHLRDEHPEIYNTLMESVDKGTPMKVNLENKWTTFDYYQNEWYRCPHCDYKFLEYTFKYCPDCGQRLDWSDE